LRQILTALEKAGRVSSTGSTGSDVYGSMMVGALADAVASAGGVGLAKYVTTSLEHSPVVPPNHPSGIPLQRPNPTAIQPPSKTSEKGIP
jgi:Rod binding domain-containing protein